jgi:hypothetical protein
MRAMEALVAGALRREQEAYGTTQRLAAEIEQLNRLVSEIFCLTKNCRKQKGVDPSV